jgi:hypothetical protein
MYASFFMSSATLFSSQGGAAQFFPGSNLERGCFDPTSGGGAAAPVRVGIAEAGDSDPEPVEAEVDLPNAFVNEGFGVAASLVASEEAVFALCEGKVKPDF